jgi:ribonuclease R
MLAANVCAADLLIRHKHPGTFRIHATPTEEKLNQLRTFLKMTGLNLGGGMKPTAGDYAALMREIKERPDAALLQTMLLRSMQQAVYSPDNVGHFGLAYEAYAHFTSPIRRYPDLLTHRAIKAVLAGKKYEPKGIDLAKLNTTVSNAGRKQAAKDKAEGKAKDAKDLTIWDALGVHCSANERRADEASRDVENWLKCYFMQDKLGESFTGIVAGVTTFGIFVQLDELYVEGLVHVTALGEDYFQYDEARHVLRGERTGRTFGLTDRVTVQVAKVDLEARKIDLVLADEASVGSAPAQQQKPEQERGREKGRREENKSDRNRSNAQPAAPVARQGASFAAEEGKGSRSKRSRRGRKERAAARELAGELPVITQQPQSQPQFNGNGNEAAGNGESKRSRRSRKERAAARELANAQPVMEQTQAPAEVAPVPADIGQETGESKRARRARKEQEAAAEARGQVSAPVVPEQAPQPVAEAAPARRPRKAKAAADEVRNDVPAVSPPQPAPGEAEAPATALAKRARKARAAAPAEAAQIAEPAVPPEAPAAPKRARRAKAAEPEVAAPAAAPDVAAEAPAKPRRTRAVKAEAAPVAEAATPAPAAKKSAAKKSVATKSAATKSAAKAGAKAEAKAESTTSKTSSKKKSNE